MHFFSIEMHFPFNLVVGHKTYCLFDMQLLLLFKYAIWQYWCWKPLNYTNTMMELETEHAGGTWSENEMQPHNFIVMWMAARSTVQWRWKRAPQQWTVCCIVITTNYYGIQFDVLTLWFLMKWRTHTHTFSRLTRSSNK